MTITGYLIIKTLKKESMMMANELRIGNWVRLKYHDHKFQVEAEFIVSVKKGFELCQPIPLTEDWLLKFGFEHDDPNSFWRKDGFFFDLYHLPLDNIIEHDSKVIAHVKYVHQLQNLYYALTGKELIT